MGCRKGEFDHCVCDIVARIADVQSDVVEHCCDVSCEESIEALLSPAAQNDLDTVPFMLYCEGTCDLFKGKGFMESETNTFQCVQSPVFRVKKMLDDCCAVLEILDVDECDIDCNDGTCESVTINENSRTGVCITVDLKCFCGITCLPAVSTN